MQSTSITHHQRKYTLQDMCPSIPVTASSLHQQSIPASQNTNYTATLATEVFAPSKKLKP
eukprot:5144363-Ditylum_brightwellii.AAC.1